MKTKTIETLVFLIIFAPFLIGWGLNIYKLIQCDFSAPYKAEVIYTIGVFTPIGAITGYLDLGR